MSQVQDNNDRLPNDDNGDNIEQLLMEGLTLSNKEQLQAPFTLTTSYAEDDDDNDDETTGNQGDDLQSALGLFARATQDMVTATVELALGRNFACVNFCHRAVEKATQSVSLLRYGHRSMYNRDLRALGLLVDAPSAILAEMERLTPLHPAAFYADTPPEDADEVINAEQANNYIRSARQVLRWAKSLVLNPSGTL